MHDESGKIASVRRMDALTSPGFVVGLSPLLLNDFALKPYFGIWLTGKLSDFAGLFVFPLFCAALLPRFRCALICADRGRVRSLEVLLLPTHD